MAEVVGGSVIAQVALREILVEMVGLIFSDVHSFLLQQMTGNLLMFKQWLKFTCEC